MHEIFAGHDFAIKNASRHNPLQSDTRNDVRRMISKAAMKQAESLCRQQQQIFASIGDKCMGYVRINQSILGAFETQTDADRLFLMLVRTELDHPGDDDNEQRSRATWIFEWTSKSYVVAPEPPTQFGDIDAASR